MRNAMDDLHSEKSLDKTYPLNSFNSIIHFVFANLDYYLQCSGMPDFFVSYNKTDTQSAEWIAWQLESAGYSVVIQAWDFRPGSNFILEMNRAAQEAHTTIAVLSPDYVSALYTQPEWAAAFARDPLGRNRTLVGVLVREAELQGLLNQIIYIKFSRSRRRLSSRRIAKRVKAGALQARTSTCLSRHSVLASPSEFLTFKIMSEHGQEAMNLSFFLREPSSRAASVPRSTTSLLLILVRWISPHHSEVEPRISSV